MAKTKDFYGKDITEVIEQACKEYGVAQDALDIDVIETGSAGIFGLCKKKAHVRVSLKPVTTEVEPQAEKGGEVKSKAPVKDSVQPKKSPTPEKKAPPKKQKQPAPQTAAMQTANDQPEKPVVQEKSVQEPEKPNGNLAAAAEPKERPKPVEPPSAEVLAGIREDLEHLLQLMGNPAQVEVAFEGSGIRCNITGDDEESIVGPEGRTLDSLQYLLRKMMSRRLPDRMMLSLNAGDFRERRAEELKVRAVELATQVKEDGKTQAIPALNPSERRVVHMVLQEDKGVRSRSVGEGLFKKVLIYKPGKGKKNGQRKRRGKQGGQPTND